MTEPPLPTWAQPKAKDGPPAPGSALDTQYETFIGPRWETSYRRKFTPFFEEPRFQPTWNWSAALFSPIWFLYRKLYLPFIFFWLAPGFVFTRIWRGEPPKAADVAADPTIERDFKLILLGVQLAAMVLAGGTANYLLFRRARAAITLAEQRAPDMDTLELILTRLGGVNRVGVAVVLVTMLVAGLMMSTGGAPGAP
jgi:hypothetical protein